MDEHHEISHVLKCQRQIVQIIADHLQFSMILQTVSELAKFAFKPQTNTEKNHTYRSKQADGETLIQFELFAKP